MPGWYLAAGCVAQTVWNVLGSRPPDEGIRDYDLPYFEPSDLSWEAEDGAIQAATPIFGGLSVAVEVRNEARVHLWYEKHFGVPCPPYSSTEAAIDTFPSLVSCVGIRLEEDDHWRVYAPFGLSDLLSLVVRPNPTLAPRHVYEEKVSRWRRQRPSLRILPWPEVSETVGDERAQAPTPVRGSSPRIRPGEGPRDSVGRERPGVPGPRTDRVTGGSEEAIWGREHPCDAGCMDITSGATEITTVPRTIGGRTLSSSEVRTRRAGGASHDRNEIAVEAAAQLFCDSRSSPATARSYRTALTRLTDFCSSRAVATCAELTPSLLAEYQGTLGDLAPSTRWHRLSVVRAFLSWASSAGWCDLACSDVIRPVRQRRPARLAPWSVAECRRLLAAGESWRDRALVAVLVASGARIGEMVAAAAGDFDGKCLVLTGKTGPRSVPLGPSACSALTWYLRHRQSDDPTASLFLGRQGRLSARQARDVVHLVCRRARLSPRGPHAFRHAAASRWLRAGIPLAVVSAALGHARTSTTVDNYGLALAADLACGLSADPLWAEDGARTGGRPVGEEGTA